MAYAACLKENGCIILQGTLLAQQFVLAPKTFQL